MLRDIDNVTETYTHGIPDAADRMLLFLCPLPSSGPRRGSSPPSQGCLGGLGRTVDVGFVSRQPGAFRGSLARAGRVLGEFWEKSTATEALRHGSRAAVNATTGLFGLEYSAERAP